MSTPLTPPPRFYDELRLVAMRSAIHCAGLFVISTLTKWGAGSVLLDAVGEVETLVTNAVKATGVMDEQVRWTEITRLEYINVRLLGFEASVRIEVWDSAPNPPVLGDDDDSPVKRSFYPTARGKVVWAELAVFAEGRGSSQLLQPPPEQFAQDPELLRQVWESLGDL